MKSIASTLLGVFVFCAMTHAALSHKEFIVHFPSDGFTLDTAAIAELDKAVVFTNGSQYFEVILDAHTDNDGTDQYNVELSKKRAVSVREYLMSKGVNGKVVQVNWFGELKPLKANVTTTGKQANRRVTVDINVYDWKSAQDMLSDIGDNRQEFTIKPNKTTNLVSSGGVKIQIPANAFVTSDGQPVTAQDITIVFDEALSKESWLTEGLSTMSPEGMLESGGMFRIEAQQSGEQLTLKKGTQIDVEVPFQSPAPGMALFVADKDASGNMTWRKTDQPVEQKRNVELPALQVDMAKLDALIKKYATMRVDYVQVDPAFYELTPAPQFKATPPRKPKTPDKAAIRVPASGTKTAFMTKRKENEMIEEIYQKKMKVYEKNMEYYNKRLVYYNEKKEKFDQAVENYETSMPEYARLVQSALVAIDSLRAAFELNRAYEQMELCLSSMKFKLGKEKITDPKFISSLMSTYSSYIFFDDDISSKSVYPAAIMNIRAKLNELGVTTTTTKTTDGLLPDNNFFRSVWGSDAELSTFFSEAQANLMNERLKRGLGTSDELSGYYLTSLPNLGWINCDRFIGQKLEASLTIKYEPESKVYVVFDDINSMLQYTGGTLNVPSNTSMTIFSVVVKDNLPHYAISRVDGKKKTNTVQLKYQEGLLQDIKNAIKQVV